MYERAKTRKLSNAIVGYFFRHHITNVDVRIRMNDDKTDITVEGYTEHSIEGIEGLCERTYNTRRVEFEDTYDELLGIRDSDDEMELIGYLVDEAHVYFGNNKLAFNVVRYRRQGFDPAPHGKL
jgi:hypothetical protein